MDNVMSRVCMLRNCLIKVTGANPGTTENDNELGKRVDRVCLKIAELESQCAKLGEEKRATSKDKEKNCL